VDEVLNVDEIRRDVVVIGASAGGIAAASSLLSMLPADLPATLCLVIHRGARSAVDWSTMLGRSTTLRVVEPADGDTLTHGCVYVAPSDRHMTLKDRGVFLDDGPKQHYTRPAIDPLFTSASKEYGPRVLAVLLSGSGKDGTEGLLSVTSSAGIALVQSPAEAEHGSMARYALSHDHVSAALRVDGLAAAIDALARGKRYDRAYPLQA
jgi:two-component system chemotaxis response regulator CheB